MTVISTITTNIRQIWAETRRLLLVLWLCRISTLSALLGLGLALLPQMQDLYTEVFALNQTNALFHPETIAYWAIFYALCFLWAFTVHYCARTVLSFETWPLTREDAPSYAYWIKAVPRYLGWICILAIFIGQINALKNLQIDNDLVTQSTSSNYAAPLFLALLCLIIVQTIRQRLGKIALLTSGFAILYWLITAYQITADTELSKAARLQINHNLALPVVTILWGVVFYYFVAKRRSILEFFAHLMPAPHHLMLQITRRAAEHFPIQIRPMHNPQTRVNTPKFFPFKKRGLLQFEAPSENVRGLMLGLFCLTGVMGLWLAFAINDPGTPPFGLKRALLLPVLLGIWVPLLTSISFLSNHLRFPLLTTFIFAGFLITALTGDNHDIKLASPYVQQEERLSSTPRARNKLTLKQALTQWMAHHKCQEAPRTCPAPIIIAASGGASRSAFYVATVLGQMHDTPQVFWPSQLPQSYRPRSAKAVKEHIFAISSVSGGSLGSAAYAALIKAEQTSLFPGRPCSPDLLDNDPLHFEAALKSAQKNLPANNQQTNKRKTNNWKKCLQALTAGDFLSPTMIAYAFRDNLAISSLIGKLTQSDRAAALENAWISREKQLTSRSHLADPLLSFQPNGNVWMPLLLFNATSVTTGKRLIASPLTPTYAPADKIPFAPYRHEPPFPLENQGPLITGTVMTKALKANPNQPLFTDSLDLHQILSQGQAIGVSKQQGDENWPAHQQSQADTPDITLSKAISLSARFPLISPHANLRGPSGKVIDRVVDGGYFDNSGMLTALELTKAIDTLTNGTIKPILVQISNHPVEVSYKAKKGHEGKKFQCPDSTAPHQSLSPQDTQLLPELTSVASALLNARVARGSHAIARAAAELGPRFIHFQVAAIKNDIGSNKKLSMSWWLSKSVQNTLNNQIKWKAPKTHAGQTTRARLTPAFCAIMKFRRAQRQHARNHAPTGEKQAATAKEANDQKAEQERIKQPK